LQRQPPTPQGQGKEDGLALSLALGHDKKYINHFAEGIDKAPTRCGRALASAFDQLADNMGNCVIHCNPLTLADSRSKL
jgi:hypothetical protein